MTGFGNFCGNISSLHQCSYPMSVTLHMSSRYNNILQKFNSQITVIKSCFKTFKVRFPLSVWSILQSLSLSNDWLGKIFKIELKIETPDSLHNWFCKRLFNNLLHEVIKATLSKQT